MNNPDFAELKRVLCKIDDKSASDYLNRYMEGGYVEPTYQEYGDYIHTKSSAIISELIDIIKSQSEGLNWYHTNAMTFKHCQEVSPDVEEYCSGDLAKGVLSETNTRLQKLREG